MNINRKVLLFIFLSFLSSCGFFGIAPEWKYEKDGISLSYQSDSQLNSYQGNPHTLMLCIYQLKDPNAFNQLVEEEGGLSKLLECSRFDPSVTSSKKLVIHPGKVNTESLDRAEGTKYVGIAGGYYMFDKERAMRFYQVPLSFFFNRPTTLKMKLYLGSQEIQLIGGK
jgi:type VI secretion system VasD/TssJ family lipoprotein